MDSGYEQIYSSLLPRLAACDLAGNARRLGADAEDGGARLRLLNREYLITKGGVAVADGGDASAGARNVIIYYITSEGAGEPSGDFAPLNRIAGAIDGQSSSFGYSALSGGLMSAPLLRDFGNNSAKFNAAMEKIGGEKQPSGDKYKHVWNLRPLPKILMQISLYEADDEFPADFQVMFDKTATRYLEVECLSALAALFVDALAEAAGQS